MSKNSFKESILFPPPHSLPESSSLKRGELLIVQEVVRNEPQELYEFTQRWGKWANASEQFQRIHVLSENICLRESISLKGGGTVKCTTGGLALNLRS